MIRNILFGLVVWGFPGFEGTWMAGSRFTAQRLKALVFRVSTPSAFKYGSSGASSVLLLSMRRRNQAQDRTTNMKRCLLRCPPPPSCLPASDIPDGSFYRLTITTNQIIKSFPSPYHKPELPVCSTRPEALFSMRAASPHMIKAAHRLG